MSILSNDAVHLLLQCVCDDKGSPWSLRVINICSSILKHCAPFSDTSRVHNMFAIDCNKSSVNLIGSNFFRLRKPNHATHLTVGGIWYQRVHCHNPLHSQREKVRCTNCARQLCILYWTHQMTHLVQWSNCAGWKRKRSLLSERPSSVVFVVMKSYTKVTFVCDIIIFIVPCFHLEGYSWRFWIMIKYLAVESFNLEY